MCTVPFVLVTLEGFGRKLVQGTGCWRRGLLKTDSV